MTWVCSWCGSKNVVQDACVDANDHTVILTVYDNADCIDCEKETSLSWIDDEEPDSAMDGDHDSAMASAGFGTDEDYGGGDAHL